MRKCRKLPFTKPVRVKLPPSLQAGELQGIIPASFQNFNRFNDHLFSAQIA
jgi:hypothetical protein